ncbi:hypothetical protein HPP92_007541 [Vanilla planifolia]|uniref:AB hydrolase-1 domain-containing protein n=1 Tax=Vanilla planifolia TaxID=51239 RepID=A0A835RIE3_VANPL|nr:hypothetical protein HPP92_007541 [Vanilla planifolia]
MDMRPRHFVLVHGAGHGAWCWFKLRHLFEAAGHRVSCLDLAGSGIELSDPDSIHTFDDYNKPLSDFMSALPQGEKVVLVGHSAGGLSLSHCIQVFGAKITEAIFVAATMLPFGFALKKMPNMELLIYQNSVMYATENFL